MKSYVYLLFYMTFVVHFGQILVTATGIEQDEGGCEILCVDVYKPVCGSDGKTYPNPCELQRAACSNQALNLIQKSEGECSTASDKPKVGGDCMYMCPSDYEPVCGSNGKTYSNACELDLAVCKGTDVSIETQGACGDSSTSGSNGNDSSLADDCNIVCTEEYSPVCASNGKEYGNDCFLKRAQCEDPTLEKVSDRNCGTESLNKSNSTASPPPPKSAASSTSTTLSLMTFLSSSFMITISLF